MPTTLLDLVANALLKVVLLLVALAAVSLLHWVLGPESPPPPVPSVANLVLFWQLGSAAPPVTNSYRTGCRRYTRGVTDALSNIVDSRVFRARSPSVRLIMPAVCHHPKVPCATNRWPALLQRQLFARADWRVERKSRLLNCSSEAERAALQHEDLAKAIALIQAHCRKAPEDLVAYFNTAAPRGRERSGLPALLESPVRAAAVEALLGKLGETQCLQGCFSRRADAVACGPRRHAATFWWARCSAVNREGLSRLSAAWTASRQARHAWNATAGGPPLHAVQGGTAGDQTCWATKP